MPRPRRNRYQANEAADYGYTPDAAFDYGAQSYGYGSGHAWQGYGNISGYQPYSNGRYPLNNPVHSGYQYPAYDDRGDYSGDYGSDFADYSTEHYSSSPSHDQQSSYHTSPVKSSQYEVPSSPTPASPPQRSPSPSYLQTSLIPSTVLSSPSARKLLILDLNGTLLLRSPRPPGQRRVDRPPPLRKVHPRPYLTVFVEYLLHPENKTWLDTMVWSSAQPHSVNDMVDKCFGKRKNELIAIWARDKMGLTQAQYYAKTQTTKDLTKPWTELANHDDSTDRLPSQRRQSPHPSIPDETLESTLIHSAQTTLLLDDSPLKATLQPYNHLCIHDYDAKLRAKDLLVMEKLRPPEEHEAKKEAKARRREERLARWKAARNLAVDDKEKVVDKVTTKKRKQKGKKHALTEDTSYDPEVGQASSSSDPPASPPDARPMYKYDESLLAVIGVLDALKFESNVAAWIRSGRLWAVGVPTQAASSSSPSNGTGEYVGEDGSGSDLSIAGNQRRKKRKVGVHGGNDAVSTNEETMWLSHPPTLDHWSGKGKKALGVMGIEVTAGVEP